MQEIALTRPHIVRLKDVWSHLDTNGETVLLESDTQELQHSLWIGLSLVVLALIYETTVIIREGA